MITMARLRRLASVNGHGTCRVADVLHMTFGLRKKKKAFFFFPSGASLKFLRNFN